MKSQSDYEKAYRDRSMILAFDPLHPGGDPKQPMRSTKFIDLSPEGCERELSLILGEQGELERLRAQVKELIAEAERKQEADGKPQTAKIPDHIQTELNQKRAKIAVLEAESRHLHYIQKTLKEREERASRPNKRQRQAALLAGKYRDGVLVEFAGRPVKQNEDGKDVFEDDGTLVADHIARVRAKERARFKKKKERQQRIDSALEDAYAAQ